MSNTTNGPSTGGKRPKSYYTNFKKKQKGNVLVPGTKGFMLTCNAQEQSTVREAYNILNEYADKLYGHSEEEEDTSIRNIEENLEAELNALKSVNANKRRFHQLHTGVKNVLFIQAEIPDPCKLALSIMNDLKETKKQKTKFLLRLVPVLNTCKPFSENLKKTVIDVLDFFLAHYEYYQEGRPVGYAVQFRSRNNSKSLKKDEVFELVNSIVTGKCVSWKVSLDNPELILNIDVLTNVCCVGVLPDYSSYKRYNLYELVKIEERTDKIDTELKDASEEVKDGNE